MSEKANPVGNIDKKSLTNSFCFQILIKEYTWRGTLLIEAGFILNGLACATVLRKPNNFSSTNSQKSERIVQLSTSFRRPDVNEFGQERLLSTDNKEEKVNIQINEKLSYSKGGVDCKADKNIEKIELSNIGTNESDRQTKVKRRWLSLRPLKSPGFLLFMVSSMLRELALDIPFAFLPDLMVNKGYAKEQAVWVMFIIGKLNV